MVANESKSMSGHDDLVSIRVLESLKDAFAPDEFKLPPAPAGIGVGPGVWVPQGQIVSVAGLQIPGGLIYVGRTLRASQGANDPCLIDPALAVDLSGSYTHNDMGYWPSYTEISPRSRGAYLRWLAGGRQDPQADIGYVFLFFYGLERRAIVDDGSEAQADWPLIAQELQRLLAIYGEKSHSFRRYASDLLDLVRLTGHPGALYLQPLPAMVRTYELPQYIRLALGQAAVDAAPVPAPLALAWARLDPNISLRTPATRCAAEFEQMFTHCYAQIHGAGMVLPRNRTKLKLVYRAASAALVGKGQITLSFGDTPDITALTTPIKRLQEVVDAATQSLETFSRLIGKNPNARGSIEATLALPAPLWPASTQAALQSLRQQLVSEPVAMTLQHLLSSIANLETTAALSRDRAQALSRALESQNIGMEPDILAGARVPTLQDTIVLFEMDEKEARARETDGYPTTEAYRSATLTLQLACAVAAADGQLGEQELTHLKSAVRAWDHLSPAHNQRLLAHLQLLAQAPVSLTNLKKRLEPLGMVSRQAIARFMVSVAQVDGQVSGAEIKMLERVYRALGLPTQQVFGDVHEASAGLASAPGHAAAAASSVTPAPVVTAAAPAATHTTGGFKLDAARIAALQQDTHQVSALLASIFTEDETGAPPIGATPSAPAPSPAGKSPNATENSGHGQDTAADADVEPAAGSAGLLGLDEAHSALARLLLSRPEWSREELLDAAADLDLMLDGALEHINEAAFDRHDMALAEGDDPVTINPEILEAIEP